MGEEPYPHSNEILGYKLVVESQDDITIYYKGKRILTLAVPDKEVTFHY